MPSKYGFGNTRKKSPYKMGKAHYGVDQKNPVKLKKGGMKPTGGMTGYDAAEGAKRRAKFKSDISSFGKGLRETGSKVSKFLKGEKTDKEEKMSVINIPSDIEEEKKLDYTKSKSVNQLVSQRTKWREENPGKKFPGQSEINKRLKKNPNKWD